MSALGQKRTLRRKSVAALCVLRLDGCIATTDAHARKMACTLASSDRENFGLCEPPHTALV